ncbi:alkaline phosphatase D family protein [uncultured Nevskia sp.]|uniref:alkaline phosphatase D family protein n=1 Tax=uncultured Nevskia sp. TaxID=228950 RepID=UPI0025FEBC88|nr:alkaline phosphatase D family protein [uncultured Nevskia sp.]
MGQQRRRKPKRAGLDRRNFLKSAAAGLAASTLPLLSERSNVAVAATTLSFVHGVASGDPLKDRVILWTRVSTPNAGPVTVSYLVATDPGLSIIVQTGAVITDTSRDYTVKIDAAGLEAGRTYYYRFNVGAVLSPIGRTRTLPVGNVDRLRIAVASCSSLAHGYFNAYARIAERADLDFVIHLGDYIYEYGNGDYGDARSYEPAHEILSLADYRSRHGQYKREPELQALHRQHPIIAIWDDHEFANNAWAGGAENHQPDTEGDWATRVASALQAYYEWMPTRVPDANDLRHNNRSFSIGNLADLHMLEERVGARAEQLTPQVGLLPEAGLGVFLQTGPFTDPNRQLLGLAQEDWLITSLRRAPQNKWKLIGQGVMFAQLKVLGLPNASKLSQYLNVDQWDGYSPRRDRIFETLAGDRNNDPVDNVVVLTGDIHCSWAADLTPDPNKLLGGRFGGYNALTGLGSLAVEFVCTSITSPGLDSLQALVPVLRTNNPHFKYINLNQRGYMLLDITPQRVSNEWWYVDTIDKRSRGQSFATALQTNRGENHLRRGTQSAPKTNPPAFAP